MSGIGIWSVLTFLSSVAHAQSVLRVYVASLFSAQKVGVIGGFRVRSKFLENFLSILHNNIAMGMPGRDLYVCIVLCSIHANHKL